MVVLVNRGIEEFRVERDVKGVGRLEGRESYRSRWEVVVRKITGLCFYFSKLSVFYLVGLVVGIVV